MPAEARITLNPEFYWVRVVMTAYWLSVFVTAVVLAGCMSTPPTRPTVLERKIVQNVLGGLCRLVLTIRGYATDGDRATTCSRFAPDAAWLAFIETNLETETQESAEPSPTLIGAILPARLVPKGETAMR